MKRFILFISFMAIIASIFGIKAIQTNANAKTDTIPVNTFERFEVPEEINSQSSGSNKKVIRKNEFEFETETDNSKSINFYINDLKIKIDKSMPLPKPTPRMDLTKSEDYIIKNNNKDMNLTPKIINYTTDNTMPDRLNVKTMEFNDKNNVRNSVKTITFSKFYNKDTNTKEFFVEKYESKTVAPDNGNKQLSSIKPFVCNEYNCNDYQTYEKTERFRKVIHLDNSNNTNTDNINTDNSQEDNIQLIK